MAISKSKIRYKVYRSTSNGVCAYCKRPFGIITADNINEIDVHHQTYKTMTVSRACGYGYEKALTEFKKGDCVWLHRDCHTEVHHKKGKGPCTI